MLYHFVNCKIIQSRVKYQLYRLLIFTFSDTATQSSYFLRHWSSKILQSDWSKRFQDIKYQEFPYQQDWHLKIKNFENFHLKVSIRNQNDNIFQSTQKTLFLVPFGPIMSKNEFYHKIWLSQLSEIYICKKLEKSNGQILRKTVNRHRDRWKDR